MLFHGIGTFCALLKLTSESNKSLDGHSLLGFVGGIPVVST
jgi:hypothetical protein